MHVNAYFSLVTLHFGFCEHSFKNTYTLTLDGRPHRYGNDKMTSELDEHRKKNEHHRFANRKFLSDQVLYSKTMLVCDGTNNSGIMNVDGQVFIILFFFALFGFVLNSFLFQCEACIFKSELVNILL